ncbi:MAG TPA: iron-sulfur cluster repair di-iron protein [Polyangia bacterium]|nr:iron-sulfur cluster repair di-iron protein [Polyangia bacterium]
MPSPSVDPSPLSPHTTLAAIALRGNASTAILDRHHLDFCCRGHRTLAEACLEDGVDLAALLAELAQGGAPDRVAVDWSRRSLADLIDFIVATHHAYTREAIARIRTLLAKVVAKHGSAHVELALVAPTFGHLAADLEPHMQREERVLFPYIKALESAVAPPVPPFGTVRNPVRMMMREHDRAGELLEHLVQTTCDFRPPSDACGSFRALYAALAEFRLDLMRHVALENALLFPRAVALEEQSHRAPVASTG